jgi:hypothetical protein
LVVGFSVEGASSGGAGGSVVLVAVEFLASSPPQHSKLMCNADTVKDWKRVAAAIRVLVSPNMMGRVGGWEGGSTG